MIEIEDLRVDLSSRTVTLAGQPLSLSRKEYELLKLLASNPGRVMTRDALMDAVGRGWNPNDRTVDVLIGRLRKKIEHDPAHPLYNASRASDPAYAPANLGNINGGTFHGIIIADKIDKIDGNLTVLGAVISLSNVDATKVGAGTANATLRPGNRTGGAAAWSVSASRTTSPCSDPASSEPPSAVYSTCWISSGVS